MSSSNFEPEAHPIFLQAADVFDFAHFVVCAEQACLVILELVKLQGCNWRLSR